MRLRDGVDHNVCAGKLAVVPFPVICFIIKICTLGKLRAIHNIHAPCQIDLICFRRLFPVKVALWLGNALCAVRTSCSPARFTLALPIRMKSRMTVAGNKSMAAVSNCLGSAIRSSRLNRRKICLQENLSHCAGANLKLEKLSIAR